jgi:excisionase family DNA binding protein
MTKDYYTVEQIADMLDIHPKTIQRYIREGRLKAAKVGRSWRVNGHDLSLFVEGTKTAAPGLEIPMDPHVIASSVIDIQSVDKDNAIRIMNTLTAALNTKPTEYGQSTLQCQYIQREAMVRVTLWGDIRFMAVMMDTIIALTEQSTKE